MLPVMDLQPTTVFTSVAPLFEGLLKNFGEEVGPTAQDSYKTCVKGKRACTVFEL